MYKIICVQCIKCCTILKINLHTTPSIAPSNLWVERLGTRLAATQMEWVWLIHVRVGVAKPGQLQAPDV